MTDAEARNRARQLVLKAMHDQHWADEPTEVLHQLKLIAADLRRVARRTESEQLLETKDD